MPRSLMGAVGDAFGPPQPLPGGFRALPGGPSFQEGPLSIPPREQAPESRRRLGAHSSLSKGFVLPAPLLSATLFHAGQPLPLGNLCPLSQLAQPLPPCRPLEHGCSLCPQGALFSTVAAWPRADLPSGPAAEGRGGAGDTVFCHGWSG